MVSLLAHASGVRLKFSQQTLDLILFKIFVALQKKNAMRSNSVLEHESIVANIIIAKNRVETD